MNSAKGWQPADVVTTTYSTIKQAQDEAYKAGYVQAGLNHIALISPHVDVCNYKAVTGEACDVCHWVTDTITLIRGEGK